MNKYIDMVSEFHSVFNAPIQNTPNIPSSERCTLRVRLLQEELDELKLALHNKDIVEAADACADLMVVLCGTILELGLGSKFDDIYNMVHNSNMSKACSSMEEANETVEFYKSMGIETKINPIMGRFIINRSTDNKILKSINYQKVNLKEIVK